MYNKKLQLEELRKLLVVNRRRLSELNTSSSPTSYSTNQIRRNSNYNIQRTTITPTTETTTSTITTSSFVAPSLYKSLVENNVNNEIIVQIENSFRIKQYEYV